MDWNNGLAVGEGNVNHLQQQNQSSSWMIGLQEERRRRTEEYLKHKATDGSDLSLGIFVKIDEVFDSTASAIIIVFRMLLNGSRINKDILTRY